MNGRFRLNCMYILVLSMLLHSIVSYCRSEFVKDIISNTEISNCATEEPRNKIDPSIEQIFRGPIEKKNDAIDIESKSVRVKRENKKANEKSLNEEKRSLKFKKAASKSRSSRDLPKLPNKRFTDYDTSADQDASEYADEVEDESAATSKNKESGYRSRQFLVGENSDRFIDQEERSSLYDDFETKDVAKRGISGAEDYEELDEDFIESEEDAAVDEQESVDDEIDKKKVRGDSRVKREHDDSKESEAQQVSAKTEDVASPSDFVNDAKVEDVSMNRDIVSEGRGKSSDSQINKVDSNDQEHLKRDATEKQEIDSKVSADREGDASKQTSALNEQAVAKIDENPKTLSQETQEDSADQKAREEIGLSNDNKAANQLVSDSSGLKSSSKVDESKVAEISRPEATNVNGAADTSASKDVAKLDSSKNVETVPQDQDSDYEKRVEERIQRKIDSIKEEIKREIEEKQRIREIEENNAKFDELHELEDEDEEQASESESQKRENLVKRSTQNSRKSGEHENADKRSTRRKKRQNDGQDKVQSKESDPTKKLIRETPKKRTILRETSLQKRDNPRQVFLVRNAGKKRRRRSKSSTLVHAQRSADSSLHGDVDDEKKMLAEQDSLAEKKSGSVASLTGNGEELGPLATEYGEAFGGLHGEPGVALARFKRIKRVLRPSSSKT
ncbi:uncharacterized protein LOC105661979 [Megachile rotundata]|uniref:uncharacterized protein LOC105661979 n=1 Tax=Megachile rotundata TaxID=143995 RepID=UPI0006151099|nr:PREDICTED: glutamic acid-rich protein-like [Megachile rotundata]